MLSDEEVRSRANLLQKLKTRVIFNREHGREEEASQAEQQLSLFGFSDAQLEEADTELLYVED